MKTVLTTGCYDMLHAGHIRHLEECRAMGDRLIVALNSDVSVARLKGPGRPIMPQSDREAVLRALRCVDDVRLFDGETAIDLIHEIRPAVLVNGCDRKADEVVGKEFVESYGGVVRITGGERTVSTTKLAERLHGKPV